MNFLYYALKKYLQTAEVGTCWNSAMSTRQAIGVTRIPSQHFRPRGAAYRALEAGAWAQLDSRLVDDLPLERLAGTDAIILNIDYPLGFARYHLLSRIAVNVGELRGAYVLGKAATLSGRIGDVLVPNVVYDEHSSNTYLFNNVFTARHVAPYLVYGDVLDNQRAIAVHGTFLQNRAYMEMFFRLGSHTDVEMESGPYLSALYEFIRPRRYPQDELVNLYPVPFEDWCAALRIGHADEQGPQPRYAQPLLLWHGSHVRDDGCGAAEDPGARDQSPATSGRLSIGGVARRSCMKGKAVGRSLPRFDAREKVAGEALYPGDFHQEGALTMTLLYAGRPHARVIRVDATAARALPGVEAVLTSLDVPVNEYGLQYPDQPVLCGPAAPEAPWRKEGADVVRFVGDQVAAAVATDEDTAERALALVQVEYEALPVFTDPREALRPEALALHPDYPGIPQHPELVFEHNLVSRHRIKRGDVEAALLQADVVVESTYEIRARSTPISNRRPGSPILTKRAGSRLLSPGSGRTKIRLRLPTPWCARGPNPGDLPCDRWRLRRS